MAIDLRKVAVGSWSEYALTMGTLPSGRQRFALVGRTDSVHELELATEGGPVAGGKLTVKVDLDLDLDGKREPVQKVVMQFGALDPMVIPAGGIPKEQFSKLDPKKFIDSQRVQVPADTFQTKRYRDVTPDGGSIDYWISDDVPPFGLVKMEATVKQAGSSGARTASMRLTARGKDARSTITKSARAFDQQKLMDELAGAMAPANAPAAGQPAPSNPPRKRQR